LQQQVISLKQKCADEQVERIVAIFYAASSIQGENWIFTNAAKCTSMFHCSIIWTVLESLKTCKGFVGQLQALCQGQAASNQISP